MHEANDKSNSVSRARVRGKRLGAATTTSSRRTRERSHHSARDMPENATQAVLETETRTHLRLEGSLEGEHVAEHGKDVSHDYCRLPCAVSRTVVPAPSRTQRWIALRKQGSLRGLYRSKSQMSRIGISLALVPRGVEGATHWRVAMTRFGRSTVGSDMFVTHDASREEAFIDAFASLRASATLDAHDERLQTYRAVEEELLKAQAERNRGVGGGPVPLTKTLVKPKAAAKVVLALGANREDVERHCARLATDYGFVHLSASQLTRTYVMAETKGVTVFEQWDDILGKNEWAFSTDLTLRLLRKAMESYTDGGVKLPKFIIDWFPSNLDQSKEFHAKVSPVDFALFFDVEPLADTGIQGGPNDPDDSERKEYERYYEKHQAVLNQYKSNGMVHHLRSPPDKVHVTLNTGRSSISGPVPRSFFRGEKVPRDMWTAKDRNDWVFHDTRSDVVEIKLDYEHENTYAALRKAMRAERLEPLDPHLLVDKRISKGLFGVVSAKRDLKLEQDRGQRAVQELQLSASFKVNQKLLEESIGRRVDRLIQAESY